MEGLAEQQAMLSAYQDFKECVVQRITWRDFHTTVELVMDYPWMPDGSIRADSAERQFVTLVFRSVREFRMINDLRPIHVLNPSEISWGINEISNVTVDQVPEPELPDCPVPFFRVRFHFELRPWIEIVFAEMVLQGG